MMLVGENGLQRFAGRFCYVEFDMIPFHLGWWAFVFLLGGYMVASLTIARTWHSPILEGLAVLLGLDQ